MPLQNRVQPDGEIVADSARGLFLGNRGGKIHNPATKTLHKTKRWASRQWISCVTEFKNRQRNVMGNSYTELFFLDEVTALAAGHRPCFECRRANAKEFAACWCEGHGLDKPPRAAEMDRVLHLERLSGRVKRSHIRQWNDLPNGAVIRHQNDLIAKHENGPLLWNHHGYSSMRGEVLRQVECLTPPSILRALEKGYKPLWHPTALGGR